MRAARALDKKYFKPKLGNEKNLQFQFTECVQTIFAEYVQPIFAECMQLVHTTHWIFVKRLLTFIDIPFSSALVH